MNERFYYATIYEYAAMNSTRLSKDRANALGRKAAELSREREIPIGKAKNNYFGTVNAYRNDILSECFFSTEPLTKRHGKNKNKGQESLF
jgi:hypothetical protein